MVNISLLIHDDAQDKELAVCLPDVELTRTLLSDIQSLLASVGGTANAKFIQDFILPSSSLESPSLPCVREADVTSHHSCSCNPDPSHLKFLAGNSFQSAPAKRRGKSSALPQPAPLARCPAILPSKGPLKNSSVKVSLSCVIEKYHK